jgi:hypothetical protein
VNVLHWRCIAEAIQQMVVSVVVTFFITRWNWVFGGRSLHLVFI